MKKIETPTESGLYGYSTPYWTHIDFVQVYHSPVAQNSSSPNVVRRIPPVLRSRVVGAKHMGTRMADYAADAEWFVPSWWDRFRLFVAKVFKRHNWPNCTLTTTKPSIRFHSWK